MNSIRRRLILFFVVTVTLVLGVSGGYSYWRSQSELATDLKQSGEILRNRLETSLGGPLWNFDDYQIDRTLDSEMLSPQIQRIVIENNDRLVAGRDRNDTGRVERLAKLPPKAQNEKEFDLYYQDNHLQPVGKARILLSDKPMKKQLRDQVQEKIFEIALLIVVIALALIRSLTVLLVRPLRQLHDMLELAADQTDEGISDAALHLPACHYIEFADVTSGYSRIARRLFDDLQKRREAEQEMREAKEVAETAYQQLKTTQASLVQSEKMASLGGLVAGIAHEINTPVGVILTSASVLSEESNTFLKAVESSTIKKSELLRYTETAQQSSMLIQSNAERAAALIQSFKLIAVDQTSEARRTFDLGEYINEVILSLRPAFKHTNIDIEITCDEKIQVDGYPGALSQIITNMVTNSLHHAFAPDQSGKLRITAAAQENQRVQITFQDNGKGIQPENLSRIFDPFFTTKRSAGGSGLGLNIAYNLITQTLGGTISVDSLPGQGTTFTIIFPQVVPRHANASP